MDTQEKMKKIASVLSEKKAIDIVTLNVGGLTSIADGFIICSATSTPHIRALCDQVQEKMAPEELPERIEGYDSTSWVLMDYSDVVVHIFSEKAREFYSLEWLWADATNNGQTDKGEE